MGPLASLLAGLVTGETLAAVGRAKQAVIAYCVAGILAFFGVIYLLIAFTIWAARRFGAIEATLGIGVAFLVLGGLAYLVHVIRARRRAKLALRTKSSDLKNAAIAAGIAAAPALIRGSGGLALLLPALAVVGYAIYRENTKP